MNSEAVSHLRVADDYLTHIADKIPDHPLAAKEQFLKTASVAAKHIDEARRIDPAAIYTHVDEKTNESSDDSIDDFAARALYWEGYAMTEWSEHTNDIKRGINVLSKARAHSPFIASFDKTLGRAYLRIGNTKLGHKHLTDHVRLHPEDFDSHKLLDGIDSVRPASQQPDIIDHATRFFTNHPVFGYFLTGAACIGGAFLVPAGNTNNLSAYLFGGGLIIIVGTTLAWWYEAI